MNTEAARDDRSSGKKKKRRQGKCKNNVYACTYTSVVYDKRNGKREGSCGEATDATGKTEEVTK
jgi:hypothetical protein